MSTITTYTTADELWETAFRIGVANGYSLRRANRWTWQRAMARLEWK